MRTIAGGRPWRLKRRALPYCERFMDSHHEKIDEIACPARRPNQRKTDSCIRQDGHRRELRTQRSHPQAAGQNRRISVEVTPVVVRQAPTAGAMRWPTGWGKWSLSHTILLA
jgi:hypothetical protein